MKVFHLGIDKIEQDNQSSVTIGTFDGVHLGHRSILDRLIVSGHSTVITFDPHPQRVLRNRTTQVSILTPLQEKIRKLDLLGIDRLVVIPFNHEFASQSAEEFLRDILVGTIGLKHLVVGYNHSFGKDREGNIEFLKERATEYNYTLDVVDAHEISGIAISSTKIRHALQEGNLNVANGYLGTPYRLAGTVVSGNGRGKTLGYPTANIQPEDADQLIPAQGVYAVNVRIGDEIFPGVGSIGYAETFSSDNPLMIEVHIFDFERDLYGIRLKVDWVEFIRKQVKFGGKEELVIAMNEDEKKARRILSGNV